MVELDIGILPMDYTVYRDPEELDSTGYMEIGTGKYSGKHWQPGFVFVWEDAFSMVEGIVAKHLSDYDHFGMNDIPRQSGLAIASDLRQAAAVLVAASATEVSELLALPDWLRARFDIELVQHRDEIRAMLVAIATRLEAAYQTEDFACILGV